MDWAIHEWDGKKESYNVCEQGHLFHSYLVLKGKTFRPLDATFHLTAVNQTSVWDKKK